MPPSVRSMAQWQRVIDENPFAKVLKEGRQEHAVFLDEHHQVFGRVRRARAPPRGLPKRPRGARV